MMTKLPINSNRVIYVEEAWQDVDENDDVGDLVSSDAAADINDEDAHQRLRSRSTIKAK